MRAELGTQPRDLLVLFPRRSATGRRYPPVDDLNLWSRKGTSDRLPLADPPQVRAMSIGAEARSFMAPEGRSDPDLFVRKSA